MCLRSRPTQSSLLTLPCSSYRSIFSHDWGGLRSTDAENVHTNVIYFIGVIDILQEYNVRKKLEHGFKSLKYDSDKISAVSASLYAQRFLNYMKEQIRTVPAKPRPPPSPAPSRAPSAGMASMAAPQRPVSKMGAKPEAPAAAALAPLSGEDHARKEKKEKKKQRQAEEREGDEKLKAVSSKEKERGKDQQVSPSSSAEAPPVAKKERKKHRAKDEAEGPPAPAPSPAPATAESKPVA